MQVASPVRPSAPAVLAKALERAAGRLRVSDRELAAVLGVSASSVSRTSRGRRTIDPESKEGELALLFLRVYRSLDGLLGGDAEGCRRWLRAYNHHLAGVPAELLQSAQGLVRVAEYLDALRGHG
ncbi:MAG: antitoxin Xre/MbcA/ParS toxin-binding domain-containing protein [Thermoanaerobaculia bacterium]